MSRGLGDVYKRQHLLDINDNTPVVIGSYNIFVPEETGSVSVTIQAYDDDQPGTNNSRLYFSLLPSPYSHNFSVDPDTGLLRNLGPLDREVIDPALGGQIVLTVRVTDCGIPVLSTEVNVTITVEVRLGSARGEGPGWASKKMASSPPPLNSSSIL